MKRRIIVLAEGLFGPVTSKTASGAIAYIPDEIVGVIDSTKTGARAFDILGYGGDIPVVKDLNEGLALGPTHFLIGIAPTGGRLPEEWRDFLRHALRARLHILSGLHTILSEDEEFVQLADQCNVTITDFRKIPKESEVVSQGLWRTRRAKVILTVGTDCNIGKMTTMLEVHKELVRRGLKADFVATGQTGMLIRGRGVAVDSIIGDYIAGATEKEIHQSIDEGFDYILVEGQGSLTHIGYSSVTLGLIHGTMPDAMILCHQPDRKADKYGIPLPDLKKMIDLHELVVRFFRDTKVVGIGLNTSALTPDQAREVATRIERDTGLPTVDAFRFGATRLVDALLSHLQSQPLDIVSEAK